MYNIEYEVRLNQYGRPHIGLPTNRIDQPEDKFLAIELTTYILNDVFSRRTDEFDPKTIENMKICIGMLQELGDEVAKILLDGMKTSGEFDLVMQKNFYIKAETFDELNDNDFTEYMYYNNKLYKKREGLKAFIIDENQYYVMKKNEEDILFWEKLNHES